MIDIKEIRYNIMRQNQTFRFIQMNKTDKLIIRTYILREKNKWEFILLYL